MKKFLSTICALMLMTSFVSCGNTQESSSELSDSISEVATEKVANELETTTKVTTIEKTTAVKTTKATTETTTEKSIKTINTELDQKFENEDISFKYSSEWDKTIKSDEEYGYLSAEFIIDPAYEFQMKISVEPVTLEYSSNDEFIEDCDNEESKIFITDSGDKLIYYKFDNFDNTVEVRRLRAYNGSQIWIEFKDYSSEYDDIIKKIINTVDIKENFEKPTEKPTLPPVKQTESPTNPPVVVQKEEETVYYTETGSKYHYDSKCGRGTYYPCTLDEALAKGLEPCQKCAS